MPWCECYISSLITSKRWFSYWLGTARQHAITRANVDPELCSHVASLDHNEWKLAFCNLPSVLSFTKEVNPRLAKRPLKTNGRLANLELTRCPVDNKSTLTWKRHEMETFSVLLAIVREIHRSPMNFPHKGQWRGALMFSLICGWINGWVNNRGAGDLRRHRAHYDAIVMIYTFHCQTMDS